MIRPAVVLAALFFAASAPAQAGEVYAGVGLPGAMLGYAHSLRPDITVRGDVATLGSRSDRSNEEGITYDTKASFHRAGLFADWFVAGGGFRLTGGVTYNRLKADMHARGDGTNFQIGDVSVPSTAADRLDVKIEFPKVTPYLGIGYGHQPDQGWGFVADLGASFGKAKVSETRSGPNFSIVSQAEVDKEMAELRDNVDKVKAIPQVSIGVNYRF